MVLFCASNTPLDMASAPHICKLFRCPQFGLPRRVRITLMPRGTTKPHGGYPGPDLPCRREAHRLAQGTGFGILKVDAVNADNRERWMRIVGCNEFEQQEPRWMRTATDGSLYSPHGGRGAGLAANRYSTINKTILTRGPWITVFS